MVLDHQTMSLDECAARARALISEIAAASDASLQKHRELGGVINFGMAAQPKAGLKWAEKELGLSKSAVAVYTKIADCWEDIQLAIQWGEAHNVRLARHRSADSMVRLLKRFHGRDDVKTRPADARETSSSLRKRILALHLEAQKFRRKVPEHEFNRAMSFSKNMESEKAKKEIGTIAERFKWLFDDFVELMSGRPDFQKSWVIPSLKRSLGQNLLSPPLKTLPMNIARPT